MTADSKTTSQERAARLVESQRILEILNLVRDMSQRVQAIEKQVMPRKAAE